MLRFILALVAAAPLVGAAQDAAAPGTPPGSAPVPAEAPVAAPAPSQQPGRQGVYLGVGLGAASFTEGSGGESLRIRLGVARSPRLLFGFEGGFAVAGSRRLSFYDVGATFFPWERYFFVRGALGLTLVTRQEAFSAGTQQAEQGSNLLLGLGCAFSGRPGLNLSVNLEALHHRTAQAGTGDLSLGDRGDTIISGWLGLDWY